MAAAPRARLTVDLDALAHNHAILTQEAGGATVAPVVKSDGYGLGAGPIARRLHAEGAREFFVARLDEGETLRAELGDREARIYVLDGAAAGTLPRFAAARLTPVLTTLPQVTATSAWAVANGGLEAVLHVDTGMNRQGLTPDETRALAQAPDRLRGLEIGLVMSHLGSAAETGDPRSADQLAAFRAIRPLFSEARASLAASAGIFRGAEYRFDVVRPGVSLYGGGPFDRPDDRLKAVATLTAPILDIRNLRPGDRLAYGRQYTADRPVRAAIVAAGYTDGVIRASNGGGYGWIAGARRPLLAVTMDVLAIDIGDAAVTVGDAVELLGPNAHLDDQAAAAGTVAHEVLVRLSRRAERIYLGGA
ncbi:alanine racemase [Phenylobacterium sp. VNQ135]|uniref:alanine racemase n=1 Tax=Phenylobacterium sp. VNQ135 TaxID=3400922 RepID=UPI003C0EEEF0